MISQGYDMARNATIQECAPVAIPDTLSGTAWNGDFIFLS
jgi:hypothetical protein